MSPFDRLLEATAFVKQNLCHEVDTAIICGTGLGPLASQLANPQILPYSEIPGFPMGTVKGHGNRMIYGDLAQKKVLAFQGRFHFYEGYGMDQITLPVRVMQQLGVKTMIVTNAAGGLNRNYSVGDIMIIEDHINFMFQNPLIGPNLEELGPRFPDMSEPYSRKAGALIQKLATKGKTRIQKGVYLGVTGPSYETRSELRFFARHADAVGMSTIPEVIAAQHSGIPNVLGLSVITNLATGEDTHKESHDAVLKAADEATARVLGLVETFCKEWDE
jgi:purine-nucleoside phosphorylase